MAYTLSVVPGMQHVDRAAWDALAAPCRIPLLDWGYLALLEASGTVAEASGWFPNHLLLHCDGRLVAAAPFYVRTASSGEYLPDGPLQQAAAMNHVAYHPRLVGTVPCTPAPGWRVLVAPEEDALACTRRILEAALQLAQQGGMSGLHLPWPDLGFAQTLSTLQAQHPHLAFAPWQHQQYLWTDEGYGDFEGLLAAYQHRKRNHVHRERRKVREAGLVTRIMGAAEASSRPDLLAFMGDCYHATADRYGDEAARFHTRAFFLELPRYMPGGWSLAAAFQDGDEARPVALTFLLESPDQLWVRHWGAPSFHDRLHFELTFYLPLEYALATGRRFVDPGRGGVHKARRGFTSTLVPSFHLPFHPTLRAIHTHLLPVMSEAAGRLVETLNPQLPWRQDGSPRRG